MKCFNGAAPARGAEGPFIPSSHAPANGASTAAPAGRGSVRRIVNRSATPTLQRGRARAGAEGSHNRAFEGKEVCVRVNGPPARARRENSRRPRRGSPNWLQRGSAPARAREGARLMRNQTGPHTVYRARPRGRGEGASRTIGFGDVVCSFNVNTAPARAREGRRSIAGW